MAEDLHTYFACPNIYWLIYFSYSSWSNPITQTPNGSTIILEIPNFFQINLNILRFVDKPEFYDARLWRVAERAVQD